MAQEYSAQPTTADDNPRPTCESQASCSILAKLLNKSPATHGDDDPHDADLDA